MRRFITVLVLAAAFVGPASAHKIITINGGDCPACPMCPACPACPADDDDSACLSASQCTQVCIQAVREDAPLVRRCHVAHDPRWRHMRVLKCRVVYPLQ